MTLLAYQLLVEESTVYSAGTPEDDDPDDDGI